MSYSRLGAGGRLATPFVLAVCAGAAMTPAALGQVWISRVNGNFSDPANWADGQVPVSSPSTVLTFTNRGHSSYRAFNDLGVLTVGGIILDSRTGTATFIGQSGGSLSFADGSFVRSTDIGLFRFGGVSGVVNDWWLEGNLTLESLSYGSVYIASPVAGPGSLTVVGSGPSEISGLFRLEGANSFTGGVRLESGILEISNAASLGTGPVTAAGGILRSTAAVTVNNPIDATSDLLLRTTSGITLAGPINGPGGIDLRSVGSVNTTLTLTAENTYSGPTVIDMPVAFGVPSGVAGIKAGGITLSGNGSAVNSSRFDIRNGGVLEINFTNNPGMNRLNDDAPLILDSGRLSAVGNATAGNNTVERVGPLTIHGQGLLFINGRNGGMEVSSPSITRGGDGRATAVLTLGNALSHLSLDTGPELVGGIVPWISGVTTLITSPRDLVTFDAGRLRPLTADEYATTLTAGPAANVKLPAGSSGAHNWVENNDTVTVNALVVPDFTGISGSGTIGIASGALVVAFGTETAINNNIDFGNVEGIIHTGSISTINGVISGSGGLTKSGDFSLSLGSPLACTGTVAINAGGFRFEHPNMFDSVSDFVNRTAGGGELVPSLEYRGFGTAVIDKPAEVQSGAFRLAATTAGSNALEYAGVISGPGAVYLESATTNTGRLILSADNTYTGGTRIFNAEVELNRDSNLGDPNGILELVGTAGAGLVLTGDWITQRPIRVLRVTTIDSNGHDMVWTGTLDSRSNLTKIGEGTWLIRPDGIANGDAAGWSVGEATSVSNTPGGRVELDGEFRMNWSVWSGTLAVNGSTRILNTFTLGDGEPVLAPGDIGGPGVGVMEAWSSSYAPGTRIVFDLGEQSDLIRLVTTLSRGTSGTGTVRFDFRVGPGIAMQTYTLIEYYENPTNVNNIFTPDDFSFGADVPELDGFFDVVQRPDGTYAVTFTVTSLPSTCAVDWNGDGTVTSSDISAFLTAWLASLNDQTLDADFDGNGTVNSTDISAFLTAWLVAVQEGC